MGTVYYNKTKKVYEGKHTFKDGKQKTFRAKSKREAKARLDEFERTLAFVNTPDYGKDFEEQTLFWLYQVKRNELKPKSFDRLEGIINNHVLGRFSGYKVGEINKEMIQKLLNEKAETLSYSSVKKIYQTINAIFKYSDLIKNPCNNVVIPKTIESKKEIRAFTKDEIERFKACALYQHKNGAYMYKLGLLLMVMLNTGIRRGELFALDWSDIDFESKRLTINKTLSYVKDREPKTGESTTTHKYIITPPKSKKSNRTLQLNETTIYYLEEYKKILQSFGQYKENAPIALSKKGKRIHERNLTRTFDDILRRANIEHCGIHTLRHTFASMQLENGVSVARVSEQLGHSSITITQDTYIHAIKQNENELTPTLNI